MGDSTRRDELLEYVRAIPRLPGVYRMLNEAGEVIYVGKAANLQRRVSSYFSRAHDLKTQAMVSHIHWLEFTITRTEVEALLLEYNQIKALAPKYNILLKDDKSYPYIYLSLKHPYPQLSFHRGARNRPGRYFGPYPNAGSVRETLRLLQQVFPVRQCEDSVFANRARACLQAQIKRCSGPCVGLVSPAEYERDVQGVIAFLQGQDSDNLLADLRERMDRAAARLDYENAAVFRDRIVALKRVQESQYISGERGDLDIICCKIIADKACVQQFFVRSGRMIGNKQFFPKLPMDADEAKLLSVFVMNLYLGDREVPPLLLTNRAPQDRSLLEELLTARTGGKVRLQSEVKGERARWLHMAMSNTEMALQIKLSQSQSIRMRYQALQRLLGIDEIRCMVAFDISHTSGQQAKASCVVFDQNGPIKSAYRTYNLSADLGGDDYSAMAEALQRYLTRIVRDELDMPDLLLLDGGKGQLNAVLGVVEDLGLNGLNLAAISKGPDRKAGQELLHLPDRDTPLDLSRQLPALHLLQQIRDEAHRFAITGHRKSRAAAKTRSILEEIRGIGPKRRRALLRHFGGLQELQRSAVEDIAKVEGINRTLAEEIYARLHQ